MKGLILEETEISRALFELYEGAIVSWSTLITMPLPHCSSVAVPAPGQNLHRESLPEPCIFENVPLLNENSRLERLTMIQSKPGLYARMLIGSRGPGMFYSASSGYSSSGASIAHTLTCWV